MNWAVEHEDDADIEEIPKVWVSFMILLFLLLKIRS